MATLYFAYGANLDRAHMTRLCPGATAQGLAQLDQHQVFIAAAGFASVRSDAGTVHGVLWQVSERDFVALDGYESVPTGLYRRETRVVRLQEANIEAAVYVASDARPGRPRPSYRAMIVAAARAWNLPEDHVRRLEAL
ncbi:MAG TPA: gamma-glutamylcyclotransferase [Xanthobacteraceae bacterium]|jgi:gamma-glutamylcyclotransferase (GGCT)/AIG2-like uncharacterized protein YtfP|nr:gamma-glutamylcyclotransferase [Xanthobacteraceae bacterium]